eukprot:CAMPEP_0181316290 /NCGR_PEP_ID=MMETSP1101-20121128/15816_1 /TAXON_ID=46948 /ORGANISM="Rhodomonas abbreviata, Strain Caron Lab Isolate" /LENGTH=211 /DNA_ID=CAMNT_0023423527 /DNA_START=217 /DNA_END=852 /DNA_ORIENTATION=-
MAHLQCELPGALHAGLKAAKKSKRAGKKRKDALLARGYYWRQIERENKLQELMEKYDKSKTGNLDREELADLLMDASSGGRKPSDEEINFVLNTTHREDKTAADRITKSEIAAALDVWKTHEASLAEVEAHFAKYDVNKSGKLERNQLKALLTDLDEGLAPTDEEVDMVMKTADGATGDPTGGINKTELMLAISLWYTHVEDKDGKCCVVM